MDDGGAPRGPGGGHELAVTEDEGWTHAGAGTLSGLDAVGDGGIRGDPRKVGEFVVQEEATLEPGATVRDDPAPEALLDGHGHGDRVPLRIHDAQVRGPPFDLDRVTGPGDFRPGRDSGLRLAHGLVPDQAGTLREVGGVEKGGPGPPGRGDEVGVTDVLLPVRVREARGLRVQMEPVGIREVVNGRISPLDRIEDPQDLRHGKMSGGGRRETAELPLPPRCADGIDLDGKIRVARQVLQLEEARTLGVGADASDDVLGHRPMIEGGDPLFGHPFQDMGQCRVLEKMPHGPRLAIVVVERVAGHVGIVVQERVEPGAHRKAIPGQRDGRLEEGGPGESPMDPVGFGEHGDGPRSPHRQPARHRLLEGVGVPIRIQEETDIRRHRCRLPTIEGGDLGPVEVHEEGTTADPAGLGFDQGQHHLHGDGRVHRGPAGLQDLVPRVRRQGMRRRRRRLDELPARLLGVAGPDFRSVGDGVDRLVDLTGDEEEEERQKKAADRHEDPGRRFSVSDTLTSLTPRRYRHRWRAAIDPRRPGRAGSDRSAPRHPPRCRSPWHR
jgi:hypothetical protein